MLRHGKSICPYCSGKHNRGGQYPWLSIWVCTCRIQLEPFEPFRVLYVIRFNIAKYNAGIVYILLGNRLIGAENKGSSGSSCLKKELMVLIYWSYDKYVSSVHGVSISLPLGLLLHLLYYFHTTMSLKAIIIIYIILQKYRNFIGRL
jgi:hypothetical protein